MNSVPVLPAQTLLSHQEAGYRLVFVRDLALMARLGIYDHEKAVAQRVIINIDLGVLEGLTPLVDGDISTVVSYELVVRKVEALIGAGHIHLVETLAEMIAAACLKDKRVIFAKVRVEKPDIISNARSVGVEIMRHQKEA